MSSLASCNMQTVYFFIEYGVVLLVFKLIFGKSDSLLPDLLLGSLFKIVIIFFVDDTLNYQIGFKNATLGRRKKIFRKCNMGKGKGEEHRRMLF